MACWAWFLKDLLLPPGSHAPQAWPRLREDCLLQESLPRDHREVRWAKLWALMLFLYPFPPIRPGTHRGPCPPPKRTTGQQPRVPVAP